MPTQVKNLPVDEIVRHYRSGKPYKWLMKKYGVCYQTILNRLRSTGVELRGHPRRYKFTPTALDWNEEVLDAQDALDEADTLRDAGLYR